jgi:hypothetical protein
MLRLRAMTAVSVPGVAHACARHATQDKLKRAAGSSLFDPIF